MTTDLDHLATLTADLESGHHIETVLARYDIPSEWSAFDVVKRQQHNRRNQASASTEVWREKWKAAAIGLNPCIEAIAETLTL